MNDDFKPPVPANDDHPVYVDGIQKIAGRPWCHMFCADRAKLHAFARRIGLKRCWFHNSRWPHYDLGPNQRIAALKAGAVAATRDITVDFARRHERKKAG